MSQCHNVTIAQLSKCIVTHNVTIALHLDQNASHLYCKQSVFWIVSISGSNYIRNKLTEKVYILERFASHKCSSRSTFEKVFKRVSMSWVLGHCLDECWWSVQSGLVSPSMSMGSKAASHDDTGVTWATLWHRLPRLEGWLLNTSTTEVSRNDTRTAKRTTPICVSKASWNSLKKSLMNRHSSATSTF